MRSRLQSETLKSKNEIKNEGTSSKEDCIPFNRLCIYDSCPAHISQAATRSSENPLWHIWNNMVLCVLLKDTTTQRAQGEGIKPVTAALYRLITVTSEHVWLL